MTNRKRFETWAGRQDLLIDRIAEVTRNGPVWRYVSNATESAWKAWEAQRRHYARSGK